MHNIVLFRNNRFRHLWNPQLRAFQHFWFLYRCSGFLVGSSCPLSRGRNHVRNRYRLHLEENCVIFIFFFLWFTTLVPGCTAIPHRYIVGVDSVVIEGNIEQRTRRLCGTWCWWGCFLKSQTRRNHNLWIDHIGCVVLLPLAREYDICKSGPKRERGLKSKQINLMTSFKKQPSS